MVKISDFLSVTTYLPEEESFHHISYAQDPKIEQKHMKNCTIVARVMI